MYCKSCGAKNDDESAFCNRCGKPVQKENGLAIEQKETAEAKGKPESIKEKKMSNMKFCMTVLGGIFLVVLIFGAGYYFYANSQGRGKEGAACDLLTGLLRKNFGEEAAKCRTFTVTSSPEKGFWFPDLGVIVGGQDIGVAVLSNGTVMRDVIHNYKSGEHGIRVQRWDGEDRDYLER